jgi:hypothetical protein
MVCEFLNPLLNDPSSVEHFVAVAAAKFDNFCSRGLGQDQHPEGSSLVRQGLHDEVNGRTS